MINFTAGLQQFKFSEFTVLICQQVGDSRGSE